MGGEEAKDSKRESGGDITLKGQEEGYRRKCKQDWDNLSYRILGVTTKKHQYIRSSNLVHWYRKQYLLFQHKVYSGHNRNIWEGEKALISWQL